LTYFNEQEQQQLVDLIEEGFRKLSLIENDINTILGYRADKNNIIAQASIAALDRVDPDKQLDLIRRSRACLRLIKAKLDIDEFSDEDAEEVCNVLDEVKTIGKELSTAAREYTSFLVTQSETN
jgi:hypothetical protein